MVKIADTGLDVQVLETLPALPGLPESLAGTKADALQVPISYMGVTNQSIRALLINARWNRVVRADDQGRLWSRPVTAGSSFVTGNPADELYFRYSDPFYSGQPKYNWYTDQNDYGVKYGFLRFPG